MRAPTLALVIVLAAVTIVRAQDVLPGAYASASDGSGDQRVLFSDGRYEERHVREACRTGLSQRFGTWTREGEAIVVRFTRSVRIDACEPEHQITQRESSTVRWTTRACTTEEAARGASCIRLAGRAWYRVEDAR